MSWHIRLRRAAAYGLAVFLVTGFASAAFAQNQAPVAICRDVTVNLPAGECSADVAAADVDDGSFDPDGDALTFSLTPAGPYAVGQHNVTLMADDGDTTSSCSATIRINDVTDPTVTVTITANPQPVAVSSSCRASVPFEILVTDDCCVNTGNWNLQVFDDSSGVDSQAGVNDEPEQISPTQAKAFGSVFVDDLFACSGTVRVEASATDCSGNRSLTGSDSVGVRDEDKPRFGELDPLQNCYEDFGDFNAAAHSALSTAGTGDNCDSSLDPVTLNSGVDADCVGTLELALEDECENQSDPAVFSAKVDGQRPLIGDSEPIAMCYTDINDARTAALDSAEAATTDNCPGELEFQAQTSGGECVPIQIQVRATDECENESLGESFTTTIDPSPPSATCNATDVPYEVNAQCHAYVSFQGRIFDNCCVDLDSVVVTPTVRDDAATLDFLQSRDCDIEYEEDDDEEDVRIVEVSCRIKVSALTRCEVFLDIEMTASDCCGMPLPNACTDTATIVDRIPPMITHCPEPITLARGDKLCSDGVQGWLDSATVTDNCVPPEIVTDAPECGFAYGSTTTVTFTADDGCDPVTCESTITIGPPPRVESSKKGSLLIYPKVELRWAAGPGGALLQDTVIELTNDDSERVCVQLYFVLGDAPLDPVFDPITGGMIIEGEPGWDWVDCQFCMTADATTYWSMATGLPAGCQPFTTLDPDNGAGPGRPDPTTPGERHLRGFVYGWAVDQLGREITWNHLSGGATLVNYPNSDAWDYNAYAFQTTCEDPLQQPLDCTLFDAGGVCCEAEVIPGRLGMDGFQYDYSFDVLLMQFLSSGATGLTSGARVVSSDTDLTLHPITADLRQDSIGPLTTKAEFAIWNEDEHRFSGTTRCITCWDQTLLSLYGGANHFLRANLQTDAGKARIDGVRSDVCDLNCAREQPNENHLDVNFILDILGIDHVCSYDASLLGVIAKHLAFSGAATGRATAGRNLVGMGLESGWIKADLVRLPPSAQETGTGESSKRVRLRGR